MNSNHEKKTIVNYLESNSSIAEVYDGNVFLGKKYKDEVTETFMSLSNEGEIDKIRKLSYDDKACFIIQVNGHDDITYVNIKKMDITHYNAFDSMYITKNKLNAKKVKNLQIFKKVVSGTLVVATIAAGVAIYGHWFKNNSKKTEAVMREQSRIIRENPNINPKDAYAMALQNLGFVVEADNTQIKGN